MITKQQDVEDEVMFREEPQPDKPGPEYARAAKTNAILIVLGLVVLVEAYSLARLSKAHKALEAQDATTRKELTQAFNQQIAARLLPIEQANAEQFDALKTELDSASRHMGSQRKQLTAARAMVAKLQAQHEQQLDTLKQQIALKADQEKLGALSKDVNSTKSSLDSTRKDIKSIANDLGLARSQFGTLIARNHSEIETLQKLGYRNYFEFTLQRRQPAHIAGVGITLKKTSVKHHTFNVELLVNDIKIQKKGKTINEPIFIAVPGFSSFYELVVNKLDKHSITGYVSAPKDSRSPLASRTAEAGQ